MRGSRQPFPLQFQKSVITRFVGFSLPLIRGVCMLMFLAGTPVFFMVVPSRMMLNMFPCTRFIIQIDMYLAADMRA